MKAIALTAASIAASIAALSLAGPVRAERQHASPHADVTAQLAGKKIAISYGRPPKIARPFMDGRP